MGARLPGLINHVLRRRIAKFQKDLVPGHLRPTDQSKIDSPARAKYDSKQIIDKRCKPPRTHDSKTTHPTSIPFLPHSFAEAPKSFLILEPTSIQDCDKSVPSVGENEQRVTRREVLPPIRLHLQDQQFASFSPAQYLDALPPFAISNNDHIHQQYTCENHRSFSHVYLNLALASHAANIASVAAPSVFTKTLLDPRPSVLPEISNMTNSPLHLDHRALLPLSRTGPNVEHGGRKPHEGSGIVAACDNGQQALIEAASVLSELGYDKTIQHGTHIDFALGAPPSQTLDRKMPMRSMMSCIFPPTHSTLLPRLDSVSFDRPS